MALSSELESKTHSNADRPFGAVQSAAVRSRVPYRTLLTSAVCFSLAILCMPWDIELSKSVRSLHVPGDINKAIQLSESVAHTITCVFLFSCLYWTDIRNRSKIFLGGMFVLFCGVLANLAKGIIPRARPHSMDLLPPESQPTNSWSVWGKPFTESWFDESIRSFPSGHSATAIAVALSLTFIYPRGKWFFFAIASMACFQRIECGAHYFSDVFSGVTITLICSLVWNNRFRKVESQANDQ